MVINNSKDYTGRFAPSPTGPVHFGTLVAAVGSYLQAKKNKGDWLIRIEDVDTTRAIKGADTDILNTLESFGFEWDDEIVYQSQQTELYETALDLLTSQALTFPCLCSRKQLAGQDIYPGTCRSRRYPKKKPHAIRLIAQETSIEFNDFVMGKQSQNIRQQCGDFVIRRGDGLFAYQLAVVVDDAIQNITEIVRGADMLDCTPRQIYLQQQLNYRTPDYCHLPLAIDATGNKISKSEGAAKVDVRQKEKLLVKTLAFLGQKPPGDLSLSSSNDIWQWAIKHWQVEQIPQQQKIQIHAAQPLNQY